jgi:hypothetical protein
MSCRLWMGGVVISCAWCCRAVCQLSQAQTTSYFVCYDLVSVFTLLSNREKKDSEGATYNDIPTIIVLEEGGGLDLDLVCQLL